LRAFRAPRSAASAGSSRTERVTQSPEMSYVRWVCASNQAGQEREIAQIDSAGPRRHAARSDAHDSAIGHDHHGGRDELAPGDVHHSGGPHHNRLLGTRGEDRKEQKRDEGRHGAERHRENVKENRAIGYWLLAGYNPHPTAH